MSMIQQTVNACSTIGATCTLGAYLMDKLPEIAAILSVVWLLLNLVWFISIKIVRPLWSKFKVWRNKK